MNAEEVLCVVKQSGGRFTPNGDTLTVEAPAPLPDELITLVREHKQALLILLRVPPSTQQSGSGDHFPVSVLVCPLCQQAAFRYPSGRVECQHPACGTPVLERPTFVCGYCGGTRAYYPGKAGSPWGPAYCAVCGQRHEL